MALTTQPPPAAPATHPGFLSFPTFHGVEKATQTYTKGAFLQDDDAGRITESASPIDASAVTKRTFGIALRAATGVTGADVPFVWVGPQVLIEGTLSDATAGTHTLAVGDFWRVWPITKGTANWYLDAAAVSDTGGGVLVAIKDALAVVDARVYFIVTNTARGGANAGSGTY